MDNCK